jgi:hypothetical protein
MICETHDNLVQQQQNTSTLSETQSNNHNDHLGFLSPPPTNPHSCTEPLYPDPELLTPAQQVVWNGLRNSLPALVRARNPTAAQQPLLSARPPPSPNIPAETPPGISIPSSTHDRLQQAQTHWTAILQRPTVTRVLDGNRPVLLSLANQRSNCTWGDTMGAKNESSTRIYGLNVNGLTLDRHGGQFDVLCKVMKEIQADVICG